MLPPYSNCHGIVLHLFKQVDASMHDAKLSFKASNGDSERTMIAFGNFDRLCFSPISRFVDYLNESSLAYRWIGGRNDIMLYPIIEKESADTRHFRFGEPEAGFRQPKLIITNDGDHIQKRFLLVTMLYVSGEAKSKIRNYETFLRIIKKRITEITQNYNNELSKLKGKKEIIFDIFGTFNSSELAIIWAADQFAEVQFLIDQIRYLSFSFEEEKEHVPVFTSSYTIIGFAEDAISPEWNLNDLSGGAMIQLASSTTRSVNDGFADETAIDYLNSLKEQAQNAGVEFDFYQCAGEYDFVVETRPPQIQLLLKDRDNNFGPLHAKSSKFSQFFSTSNTSLYYRQDEIENSLNNLDWHNFLRIDISPNDKATNISTYWKQPRVLIGASDALSDKAGSKYSTYRNAMLESSEHASSFCSNLDFLYSDFVHAVNNTPDWQWAKDLEFQFISAIDILSKLSIVNDQICVDRRYLNNSELIFNALRQQIRHVAEAGKFFFDDPCLLSESTSQFDLLFHMYYGAVKDILSCIYDRSLIKSSAQQSNLIPVIQFQPTTIVNSELYFDKKGLKDRFVNITIPYDSWGEPGIFILSLIHELYHYAAPFSRTGRNELFAKLILAELIANASAMMMVDMYKGEIKSHFTFELYKEAVLRVTVAIREALFIKLNSTDISNNYIIPRIHNENHSDVHWAEFYGIFEDWYIGVDGYDATDEKNFGAFLIDLLADICPKVTSKLDSSQFTSDCMVFSLLETEFKTTEATEVNDGSKDFATYLRKANENWIVYLVGQLRELLPDYSMTRLSEMGLCEYLLAVAILQEKLQNSSDITTDKAYPIRIGFIIHQLLNSKSQSAKTNMEAFSTFKDSFIEIYCSYSEKCCRIESFQKVEAQKIAEKWYEKFKGFLSTYYAQYGCYQGWFDQLAKNLFLPICQSSKNERLARNKTKFFNALQHADKSQTLFSNNLEMIWDYQRQPFLSDLYQVDTYEKTNPIIAPPAPVEPIDLSGRSTILITHNDDILKQIQSAASSLENTHKHVFGANVPQHGIWYRGSQNAEFSVIPSIMVHFLDKDNRKNNGTKGHNIDGALWQYQKNLIERFRYQADGSSEFINSSAYTVPDYIAIMQHYSQHTCYLDWSENAFKSLFFALEDYIQQDKPQYPDKDAALYLMDPMLYNRARKMIVDHHLAGGIFKRMIDRSSWIKAQNIALSQEEEGYIPNLSTQSGYDKYPMFSMNLPISFVKKNATIPSLGKFRLRGKGTRFQTYHDSELEAKKTTLKSVLCEVFNLPIAVHLSRLNPRIKTQYGQFVAFSPFALPVYGPNEIDDQSIQSDRFVYLCLRKIQEYFLEEFPKEEPFLYELRIKKDDKENFGLQLRKAGINKYDIYPELDNLKI